MQEIFNFLIFNQSVADTSCLDVSDESALAVAKECIVSTKFIVKPENFASNTIANWRTSLPETQIS